MRRAKQNVTAAGKTKRVTMPALIADGWASRGHGTPSPYGTRDGLLLSDFAVGSDDVDVAEV
jgi:hypothetical protein